MYCPGHAARIMIQLKILVSRSFGKWPCDRERGANMKAGLGETGYEYSPAQMNKVVSGSTKSLSTPARACQPSWM